MENLLIVGRHGEFAPTRAFLWITDQVPDVEADIFDPREHCFNPLHGLNPRGAVEAAEILFKDKDLMTYDHGKRALAPMLWKASRLDQIKRSKKPTDAEAEALATVDDALFLPEIRRVFCRLPNFSFRARPIVARLDRAELGDKAATMIGLFLVQKFRAQIVIDDFGRFARPFHSSLIDQNRLMAKVRTLSQLDKSGLRDLCMTMPKIGRGCIYSDARELAEDAGHIPDPTRQDNPFNDFVKGAMAA